MNKQFARAILTLALGLILTPPSIPAALILNGDFEQPNLGGAGNYYGVGSTAVTGWTVLGNGGVQMVQSRRKTGEHKF